MALSQCPCLVLLQGGDCDDDCDDCDDDDCDDDGCDDDDCDDCDCDDCDDGAQ